MKLLRNPMIVEGLAVYFRRWKPIVAYQIYVGLTAMVLVLSWPKDQYDYYVRSQKPPSTYAIVAVTVFFILAFLGARFGTDSTGRGGIHPLSDWLRYTKEPIGRLLGGKILFSALHTLFLGCLAVPLLLIGASPSGIPGSSVALSALIVLACSLTYRLMGFTFVALLENYPFLLFLAQWSSVGFLALGTLTAIPRASPLHALLTVALPNEEILPQISWSMSLYRSTLTVYGVMCGVFCLAAYVVMRVQRLHFGMKGDSVVPEDDW